ncbi:MAG: ABC transporter ATP-binding protein [Thermomicrobiales bacterium]|nr:ABC transporter ATP-binding protein [Thermomicrobiales bacterium]MCO5217581.1 ABC transporter ATP-binding protein [Thermomicrobiales bacterium]MCO5224113.1 ABC transporter ATP-binding protein [Thermomicrobiales bacterium]MCO5226948.1 ABC transporter ATP-binding protein [Thermomicrobiales bacterium]
MTLTLQLEQVSKFFPLPNGDNLSILSDINFGVERGEVVAIVGKSGSGKSTLLNQIGLLDFPTGGEVWIEGRRSSTLSDTERARLRGESIGFIFQQFFLMDRRTALENVAEPTLYGTRVEMDQRCERARDLLTSVGLAHRLDALPGILSGGEQQRVAIARALVRRPSILLADEPTGALDADTSEIVLDILLDVCRVEETALILVTHDMEIASRADRILRLERGKLQDYHAS